MQMFLPIFPSEVTLINGILAVRTDKDGMVTYFMNTMPIRQHHKDDLVAFRSFTASLICNHLCRQTDIQRCFSVSQDGVGRSVKLFRAKGEAGFYAPGNQYGAGGRVHKLVGGTLERIQKKLGKGQSVNSIAKEEGIREGTIRAAVARGDLKKNR